MESGKERQTFIARLKRRYAANRVFWDGVVLAVWCETAVPFEARRPEEKKDWQDILLPYYVSIANMNKAYKRGEETVRVSGKSGGVYRTARQVLTAAEKEHLQAFIDAHYTEDVTAFRLMAEEEDVFNTCMTSCLGDIRHLPYRDYAAALPV